nr:unnamed protein product [Digitaria exilis]
MTGTDTIPFPFARAPQERRGSRRQRATGPRLLATNLMGDRRALPTTRARRPNPVVVVDGDDATERNGFSLSIWPIDDMHPPAVLSSFRRATRPIDRSLLRYRLLATTLSRTRGNRSVGEGDPSIDLPHLILMSLAAEGRTNLTGPRCSRSARGSPGICRDDDAPGGAFLTTRSKPIEWRDRVSRSGGPHRLLVPRFVTIDDANDTGREGPPIVTAAAVVLWWGSEMDARGPMH